MTPVAKTCLLRCPSARTGRLQNKAIILATPREDSRPANRHRHMGDSRNAGSAEDLPARLEAVEFVPRVLVHRVIALRDLDRLRLPAERCREVALAGVVDDGHDGGEVGVPARQL